MELVVKDHSRLPPRTLEPADFTGRWRIVHDRGWRVLEVELIRRHFFGLIKITVWVDELFIRFYEIETFDCNRQPNTTQHHPV